MYQTFKQEVQSKHPKLICKTVKIKRDLYYFIIDSETGVQVERSSALTGNDAWRYAKRQLDSYWNVPHHKGANGITTFLKEN